MYLSNYPISIKLGVIYVCYTNLCKYTLSNKLFKGIQPKVINKIENLLKTGLNFSVEVKTELGINFILCLKMCATKSCW